jgi:ATP-dependent DNA helicase RecQ
VQIDGNYYRQRFDILKNKINAMINYVHAPICRSVQLRSYFDEKEVLLCGQCDICLLNKQTNQKVFTFARLANMIGAEPLYLNDLLIHVNDIPEQEVLAQIQVFAEEGLIQYANKNEVIITQKGLLEKDHINHN